MICKFTNRWDQNLVITNAFVVHVYCRNYRLYLFTGAAKSRQSQ